MIDLDRGTDAWDKLDAHDRREAARKAPAYARLQDEASALSKERTRLQADQKKLQPLAKELRRKLKDRVAGNFPADVRAYYGVELTREQVEARMLER